ncbi:MAG: 4'-phosphopantetheinyl transferase superfamily protein [Eubacterium sp.]|nr:4'-phosphopantetheinyl transferase superfamily protein [Eubacterium sp.]
MKDKILAINTDILTDQDLFDHYYGKQRSYRRERVDRIKYPCGKRLALGAGIVMEEALLYAGCPGADIVFTEQGKPVIDSPPGSVHFNISHTAGAESDGIAVCAVSDAVVGIDVEAARQFSEPLIKKAFTENEIRLIESFDPAYKNMVCTRLWTIKESVMKWYGLGLLLEPACIEISIGSGDARRTARKLPDGQPADSQSGSFRATRCRMSPDDVIMRSDICINVQTGSDTGLSAESLTGEGECLHITMLSENGYMISVCSEHESFADRIFFI